jgi:hypothetical protein
LKENESDTQDLRRRGRITERERGVREGESPKNMGICYIIQFACILLKQNAIYIIAFPFLIF